MHTFLDLATAAAPLLLTVMGAVVTLHTPGNRIKMAVVAGFILVGLAGSVATFVEMQATSAQIAELRGTNKYLTITPPLLPHSVKARPLTLLA